jgi:uncharacterized protein
MANRLGNETSPYLRQHAHNPVDWYPWGDEAFAAARERGVPVLLSVGYSSCHWCHVMAHESFENDETAAMMNRLFVNVKVDREERPDVDAVYMEATQAMTGHGGWPMTVFMTPDGAPFYCGTYFPAESRGGQPSFRQLLEAIRSAWDDQHEGILEQADRLLEAIRRTPAAGGETALPGVATLDEATMSMLAAHDEMWGGFGRAPKFPQAMSLDHLLRHHDRTGSDAALSAVVTSLDAMAAGGIYDHLGGGFSRYAVDGQWLVPHFEKMLYDNALLSRVYLHAWQVTGQDRFLQIVEETVSYVLSELSHPDGGRYSAEDADSLPPGAGPGAHPEEGAFYVWTPEAVASVLEGAGPGAAAVGEVLEWYGITPGGNFEGSSIPNRLHARGTPDRPPEIEAARRALHEARTRRPRPGLDDKVLTEWNALMMAALAEAGAATGRADWIREAEATGSFLVENLRNPEGRWLRSWQADGGARHLGYASDHGALLDGFLCLYEATGTQQWLVEARQVAEALLRLFWDHAGGVWTTGEDAEALVTRPRDLMDNATPSANSMAAVGLLRLEAHTGEDRYGEHARQILGTVAGLVSRHGLAFGNMLWAVGLHALGVTEIVITGSRPDLVAEAHRAFTPHAVLAWGEPGNGPLWEGRDETGDAGRAYVCRNHVCEAPVSTPEALRAQVISAGSA